MTVKINMKGRRFHYLVVGRQDGSTKSGEAKWDCVCRCFNVVTVRGADLRNGHTKSCGCWDREQLRKRWLTYRKINGTKMDPRYEKGIHTLRVQRKARVVQ